MGVTDEEANEVLEWGKGPKVKVGKTPNAYANTNPARIKLNKYLVKMVEDGKSKNLSTDGVAFLAYIVILHEAQHDMEDRFEKTLLADDEEYDKLNRETEAGLVFEIKATGDVVEVENAEQLQMENFFDRDSRTTPKKASTDNIEMGGKGKPITPIPKTKKISENLGISKPASN